MIGLLEDILGGFSAIGDFFLWALETVVNALVDAFEATVLVAVAALPSLPATTSVPTVDAWLNWFYPLAAVMAVASGILSCYVSFLLVRWLFKKAGVL